MSNQAVVKIHQTLLLLDDLVDLVLYLKEEKDELADEVCVACVHQIAALADSLADYYTL